MKIIFHIEAGCLGPHGQHYVKAFCRAFARMLAHKTQLEGLTIEPRPRTQQREEEFQYISSGQPDHRCRDPDISTYLSSLALTRDSLETLLINLATDYEASDEWRQLKACLPQP